MQNRQTMDSLLLAPDEYPWDVDRGCLEEPTHPVVSAFAESPDLEQSEGSLQSPCSYLVCARRFRVGLG